MFAPTLDTLLPPARREARRDAGLPARLVRWLLDLDAGWRGRRRLRALDDHLLRDIGLSPRAVRGGRPARWNAPDWWR